MHTPRQRTQVGGSGQAGAACAVLCALAALPAAARAEPPRGPCLSPASRSAAGPLELRVGYVESPPLAWDATGRPAHPAGVAVDVLTLLARRNGWRLRFAPLAAGNVVANLVDCKIDVGVVPAFPGAVASEANPPDLTLPYLETVAAVALLGTPPGAAPGSSSGQAAVRVSTGDWIAGAVRAALFGLLGVAALVLVVWLANLRVPWTRGRLWPERLQVVALDASVGRLRAGLPWLWSSRAGRVLLAAWFLGAVGLAVSRMTAQAAPWASQHEEYVEALTALGGFSAAGIRPGGRAVECRDLARCLHDLSRGDLDAVAAGAERICHHVRAERLEHVRFAEGLLWPNAHAFLVPPASDLRRRLNAALVRARHEDAAALDQIATDHGLPFPAPTLASSCPVTAEATR